VAGASLQLLASLIDKSLLQMGEEGRYDLHELLRQFVSEELDVTGAGESTGDTHSAYYAAFIHERVEDLKGRRQIEAIAEINADFENVRTAWVWAADHRYEQIIDQMIDGLWIFCSIRSRVQEGFALFQYAKEKFTSVPGEEVQRLVGRLIVRSANGENDQVQIETALQIARHFNDAAEIAFCLAGSGYAVYMNQEYDKAIQLYEQSLAIYRQLGDRYHTAQVLSSRLVGDLQASWKDKTFYRDEILRTQREIGDVVGLGWSLGPLAVNEARLGNFAEAERLWLERVALGQEMGNLALVALGYAHVSHRVYFVLGEFDQARAAAEEALKLGNKIGLQSAIGWALPTLGLLASMNENFVEGKRLCQQAALVKGLTGIAKLAAWGIGIASCGLGDYEEARVQLSLAFRYLTHILGTVGDIASLPVVAIIYAHQGQPVRAVELLALAFTHPVSASSWMKKWPLLDRLQAELEQTLGAEDFSAAWKRGTFLNLDVVITELQAQFFTADAAGYERSNQALFETLSRRELEVLSLIADGLTNREIADQLFIGVSTVKKHIQHIYTKLDAKNRTSAVVRARELNLLP
jgi:DNA-binding CsgD family transcriptional regulator